VERPRLVQALDRGLDGMLTLVCAPAGYGKSTLLAAWTRTSGHPTAWVNLNESHWADATIGVSTVAVQGRRLIRELCKEDGRRFAPGRV